MKALRKALVRAIQTPVYCLMTVLVLVAVVVSYAFMTVFYYQKYRREDIRDAAHDSKLAPRNRAALFAGCFAFWWVECIGSYLCGTGVLVRIIARWNEAKYNFVQTGHWKRPPHVWQGPRPHLLVWNEGGIDFIPGSGQTLPPPEALTPASSSRGWVPPQ